MEIIILCLAIMNGSETGTAKLYEKNVQTACENVIHVVDAARQYKLDPEYLAALIWVESRWKPNAVSSAQACGLTQVLPKYVPESCEELKDPKTSIYAGARSLNYWKVKRGKSSIKEALACYNVGNKCLKSSAGLKYSELVIQKALWYRKWIKEFKKDTSSTSKYDKLNLILINKLKYEV